MIETILEVVNKLMKTIIALIAICLSITTTAFSGFAQQPAATQLLDVCAYGDYARPTIVATRGGKSEHRVYDVIIVFASDAEAREFATKHGIDDIAL